MTNHNDLPAPNAEPEVHVEPWRVARLTIVGRADVWLSPSEARQLADEIDRAVRSLGGAQ